MALRFLSSHDKFIPAPPALKLVLPARDYIDDFGNIFLAAVGANYPEHLYDPLSVSIFLMKGTGKKNHLGSRPGFRKNEVNFLDNSETGKIQKFYVKGIWGEEKLLKFRNLEMGPA